MEGFSAVQVGAAAFPKHRKNKKKCFKNVPVSLCCCDSYHFSSVKMKNIQVIADSLSTREWLHQYLVCWPCWDMFVSMGRRLTLYSMFPLASLWPFYNFWTEHRSKHLCARNTSAKSQFLCADSLSKKELATVFCQNEWCHIACSSKIKVVFVEIFFSNMNHRGVLERKVKYQTLIENVVWGNTSSSTFLSWWS